MKFFRDRRKNHFLGGVFFLSFLVLTGCAAREDQVVPEEDGQNLMQTTEAGTGNAMEADAGSNTDGQVTQETFSLHFRTSLNLKKRKATVRWKQAERASKYVITRYVQKKGDWEKIEEKTISADQKTVYQHKISVGKSYRYEVNVYQNVDGKEYYLLKPGIDNACYLDCKAPEIIWENSEWYVDPGEGQREYVKLAFTVPDYFFAPTGFEVYRGEIGQEAELVGTIKAAESLKEEKYIYEDDTVQSQAPYSYRIRSYVDIDGKKIYGKKSDLREASTETAWGNCKTELIVPEKNKIDTIQVVVTSQEDKEIKCGKKYSGENMLAFFDGKKMGENDRSLGLDEISYKYKKSGEYKILAPGDTISIQPKGKLFLQFARKDHETFQNPMAADTEQLADNICVNLFLYKGHPSFLHITDFAPGKNSIKWCE